MSHSEALRVVCASLAGLSHPWIVSGSMAAALHGLPVTPDDIDIESTAAGAVRIGARLSGYVAHPVVWGETDAVRSHFGKFRIAGVMVEVMGDMEIRTGEGWCAPFLAGVGAQLLCTPAGTVPVASVAALAGQYHRLGRPERAQALLKSSS